jgi:hypothetical protein
MASNQPVPDEAAWRKSKSPGETGPGSDVSASQTQEWLMERFAYLPQVRLVFGEQSPQSTAQSGNFVHP